MKHLEWEGTIKGVWVRAFYTMEPGNDPDDARTYPHVHEIVVYSTNGTELEVCQETYDAMCEAAADRIMQEHHDK